MKQLIQNFSSGELYVDEVPIPSLAEGFILVENKFSLISSGTERGTVKVAQASLLGKARQRPDLVAQVMQNIRKEGISATIKKVQTKLDTPKALGYSCAGVVLASLDRDGKYKPGDRLACAGQDYASHAEVVAVPQNLVARIPDNVSFEEASFTTLGAIALQGIRQAEPRLGERVAVIGLGLLGQLTCQLLRANGCRVFGIDLSDRLVALAAAHSADVAMNRQHDTLIRTAEAFTQGHGFDSVIITAAASSNDPIELSAELARRKGKVIVVGAVGMDVPRDPHFYRKELDLRMSCSYGPGRYDSAYEEGGDDYPYAYVRWTEQRNMEAFLDMLSRKAINLQPLITHTFDIDKAGEAFDLVLGKKNEPSIGILLRYSDRPGKLVSGVAVNGQRSESSVQVAFVGAGSFAQSYLIPPLKGLARLKAVVTSKGITSKNVAAKFGFETASTATEDVLNDTSINTIFIATPHNTHASLAAAGLRKGKHIFVEKPLAITREGLQEVTEAMTSGSGILMVGFNRRFSTIATQIRQAIGATPLMMSFRVNAGPIAKDHWIQNPSVGGGRILGEMCHFVDLMQYFAGSLPESVYARSIRTGSDKETDRDTLSIVISFRNGSVGSLNYVATGDPSLPKEHLEIFGGGKVWVIDDFKRAVVYQGNKSHPLKGGGKGHREEVMSFVQAIQSGSGSPISFDEIRAATETCFCIEDSLATGLPQTVNLPT